LGNVKKSTCRPRSFSTTTILYFNSFSRQDFIVVRAQPNWWILFVLSNFMGQQQQQLLKGEICKCVSSIEFVQIDIYAVFSFKERKQGKNWKSNFSTRYLGFLISFGKVSVIKTSLAIPMLLACKVKQSKKSPYMFLS